MSDPSSSQQPGDDPLRPIGAPQLPGDDGDGGKPHRGALARASRSGLAIGVVIVLAFFANLFFGGREWSEAELEGDLAATLQRHSVVAISTICRRHDQTVICTIRTTTPGVPRQFTVTGEIEVVESRGADDDGDVGWEIPARVLAP